MEQVQYLRIPDVKGFIAWFNGLCTESNFRHSYKMLKPVKDWSCHSVYHAFESYQWPFSSFDPVSKEKVTGMTWMESSNYLGCLTRGLNEAITNNKEDTTLSYCRAIMKWGGVLRRNEDAIKRFTSTSPLISKLNEAATRLNPQTFSLNDDLNGLFINSGFSKIYSLLIDDFVIYDSRVGAALGLLVRKYCEAKELTKIPEPLNFAYADAPKAKGHNSTKNVRDPGAGIYQFPKLYSDIPRYIRNNMKANWLIKAIVMQKDNAFNQLSEKNRMRALEAALFMIGYKVW